MGSGQASSTPIRAPFRALALLLLAGCAREARDEMRIGFLPNLTHAVPLVGEARRSYTSPEGRAVRLVPFHAGTSAVEAMLAGNIDLTYGGPGPAINAFVRTKGRVRILAGGAGRGAGLVIRANLPIDDAADLAGLRLAVPQIGNTQDIALREYLWQNGLAPRDGGGDVVVLPLPNSEILSTMRAGEIDGAWVPEPWAQRLVEEASGRLFLDERRLWPDGRFPTTLLIGSDEAIVRHPREVAAAVAANRRIVAWIRAHPSDAKSLVNRQLERYLGKPLRTGTLDASWKRLAFVDDPMPDALAVTARMARRIGYLPRADVSGIVVPPGELESIRTAPP